MTLESLAAALGGTLLLRPYVFAFLAAFLVAGGRDLGWAGVTAFSVWGFAVAWVAEYASTRVGVPFGLYHYTGETMDRELFVANVPFFDSLSFPFLAYAAWCLARGTLGRARGPAVVAGAGVLMMLLDVVIDPLAVRGERWFLGRLFYYPHGGVYWGVPLSNFGGWALVGCAIVGGFVALTGARERPPRSPGGGIGLYYGVLGFNLALTAWIGEWGLLGAGVCLHAALALVLLYAAGRGPGLAGPPVAPAGERMVLTPGLDER